MKRYLPVLAALAMAFCLAACTGMEGAMAAVRTPAAQSQGPAGSAAAAVSASLPAETATPAAAPSATAVATPSPASVSVEVIPQKSARRTPAPAKGPKGEDPVPAMANAAAPYSASAINAEAQKFLLKASRYYDSYGFSGNHYKYTSAELKMLAIVIHMEARGESYKAKLAVANVVMNRVLARGYPGETIKDVVTRPNQFCYRATVTPSAECVRAARDVLEYEVWVVPQNTYFFRSTGSKSNWGRHDYWGHIGNTAFYQDRYAGRYNGDAVPAKLFQRVYKWPQYGCKPAARVRKVQQMLKGLGYKVIADGYFGLETRQALVSFQKANNLTADGIAGPATLRRLIGKYGLNKYLKL